LTKKEWEEFEKALAKAIAGDARLTEEEVRAILEAVPDLEIDLELDETDVDAAIVFGDGGVKNASILYPPKKNAATH